ncbi:MAG: LytTR family DNA-binding domain-containing protein [Gemmiger sp.]|nr:LytTR family DNA-binding domain-containing protein [Gemmiger sp.]
MRLTVEETKTPGSPAEPELILRCSHLTPALERLAAQLAAVANRQEPRIPAKARGETILLNPADIYYFESVDDLVFAYTKDAEYPVSLTLAAIADSFGPQGLLRTGKAQVANVHHLARLQSRVGGGIDATLDNGEHLLISRRYAKDLRTLLKGKESYR